MNRIRFTVAVFVILLNMRLPLARGADDTHLLIISIDGLRGNWAAHPDKHGLKVPNLRKLAARGAHADGVLGVFPSVTYPSHTTLITGCRPARHGILANSVFDPPTAKQMERWYWDYKDIRVPTILDAARSVGWTTASVGWPVNVGAPVDVLFPEVWEPGKNYEAIVAISRLCKPPDLLAEVLTKYDLHGGPDSDMNRANVTRYIVDRYKPRMMLSHLIDLDHVEHSKGPESSEARETLERLDGYVGYIVERYERNGLLDKTIIAVVSDHGFLAVEHSFGVNALLWEKGLIRVDEKSTGPASEWDAAGWIAGGSCAILLKKPDDAATLERVREALAPYTGKPNSPIRRIIERDEIARLGSNTRAALMLDAGDGWTFSGKLHDKVEADATVRGMHGQMPDRPNLEATFIAAGPGIAVGGAVAEMRMIDVGPTLAAAVGLKLSEAEGKADQGLLAGGSAAMKQGK
ncbi:MAG: alkaline phosphatase family protein [Thermoguttaceae bacterium]